MATNLAIDDSLIEEARRIGGHRTKKETVTVALQEYIQHRKQLQILELMGTIEYAPDYDYKAGRDPAVNVLVDTSIWSLALRRRATAKTDPRVNELKELIREGRAVLMGPIRQELLSGIREVAQFRMLRDRLRAFPDLSIGTADHERAAEICNQCRSKGLQGSHVDFLLCAVAVRDRLLIFTVDQDFEAFSKHLPIRIHSLR